MKTSQFQKVKALLSQQDKKRLLLLLGPMIFAALVNIFGIAFIMPFIAVASNPSMIQASHKLRFIYELLHFSTPQHFVIFLGAVALIMLVVTNATAALTTYLSSKTVEKVRARITQSLYEKYLDKPYEFHLNYNSATLSSNLFTLVSNFTNGYILQGMQLLANGFSVIAILGFIIYLDPMLALMTAVSLGGVYSLIYLSIKKKLTENGKLMVNSTEAAYRLANESFGGIKDIKLKGSESIFKRLFFPCLLNQAKCNVTTQCMSALPKYALEVVAFGGIILLMLAMLMSGKNTATIVPIVSAYVYAGYRLMPAMQQMFTGISNIKVAAEPLNKIYASVEDDENTQVVNRPAETMSFRESFKIKGLYYNYPGHDRQVLDGITMTVNHNEIIGVIGSTGAGKTTLIDIILGLLRPQQGQLSVDGVALDSDEKIAAWQNSIGYVQQFIYLSDRTIKDNIAFGENPDNLDIDRIQESAKIAAIHDFIVNELPDGYDTIVGERGVKLSGGQIQRVGIARALYRNPSVLVLDEATSSLDTQTEKDVMRAIYNMRDKITIIIIAHRLSTVSCCDNIIMLDKGRVADQGTFDELVKRHDKLKQTVAA